MHDRRSWGEAAPVFVGVAALELLFRELPSWSNATANGDGLDDEDDDMIDCYNIILCV